jgi:methylated-DNA-[protein]-cysteine S-methyltransferase
MMRKKSGVREAYCSLFTTRLGIGGVVASARGLLEIFLPFGGESTDRVRARFLARYPVDLGESLLTRQAAELLDRYFAGEEVHFDLPVDRSGFTPFQADVYKAVEKIPFGEVKSYAGIAGEIGRPRAARGVGGAMARNPLPIIIPCHRVVGKSGEMTGYSAAGGVESKQLLLEMEKRGLRKSRTKT